MLALKCSATVTSQYFAPGKIFTQTKPGAAVFFPRCLASAFGFADPGIFILDDTDLSYAAA